MPASDPAAVVASLAEELRRREVAAPLSAVTSFVAALDHLDVASRREVYWAARLTLLTRPEQLDAFDAAFAVVFDGAEAVAATEVVHTATIADDDPATGAPDGTDDPAAEPPDGGSAPQLRFSAAERLRQRDIAALTPDELVEARRLIQQLRFAGSRRRSRRLVPASRRTSRPDARRTLRAALRTGGEPVRRHHRRPGTTPRRLVLILDVSGSMEAYSRALARFVHAAVVARRRVEAFALGTRLTRITRELATRDPDVALTRASAQARDWSGGTRIGEGLATFNRQWGMRGMARGADVVILSDGWDRGDVELLTAEMARLRRAAHRVVWVNPLKVTPGYAPLARGMAAALVHVDHFVEGHSLAALEQLTALLSDA